MSEQSRSLRRTAVVGASAALGGVAALMTEVVEANRRHRNRVSNERQSDRKQEQDRREEQRQDDKARSNDGNDNGKGNDHQAANGNRGKDSDGAGRDGKGSDGAGHNGKDADGAGHHQNHAAGHDAQPQHRPVASTVDMDNAEGGSHFGTSGNPGATYNRAPDSRGRSEVNYLS